MGWAGPPLGLQGWWRGWPSNLSGNAGGLQSRNPNPEAVTTDLYDPTVQAVAGVREGNRRIARASYTTIWYGARCGRRT